MQEGGAILVEFLHESQEVPLQCWSFNASSGRIAIGRSNSNDVVLSDRVVSRWHAEIERADSGWRFEVLGINGAYIEGQRVDRFLLWDGVCVQLGQTGPRLRFVGAALGAAPEPVSQPQIQCEGVEDAANAEPNHPVSSIGTITWTTAELEPAASTLQQAILLGPSRN